MRRGFSGVETTASKQARLLMPDNPLSELMVLKAKFAKQDDFNKNLREKKADMFTKQLNDVDESSTGYVADIEYPEVKKWLRQRPRYRLHFTPTSSPWLNQIERWFAEITRKRIRRGTFRSVRDLIKAIQDYIRLYNRNPQPFQWVASASRIIKKVNKYKGISETGD